MGGVVPTSVEELKFFAVVAASETLTAASRELGLSLPVVSKRLAALEARLGVQLVHRGIRRLSLTSEGGVFARGVHSILSEIQQLEDDVTGQSVELRGSLVVESTMGLGRAHVGPLLGEFAALHPRLDVQLSISPLPLSPHRREFDVAVHVGAPQDSSLRIRRIATSRRLVCASPEYLRRDGTPSNVADLADHNCIVLRENHSDFAQWRFGVGGDEFQVRVDGSLSSNDGDIVTGWALEGRGLIMRSSWHVAAMLADGRLVQVLPDVPTPNADVYALYADTGHVPARVSQVIDFLAQELPSRLA